MQEIWERSPEALSAIVIFCSAIAFHKVGVGVGSSGCKSYRDRSFLVVSDWEEAIALFS
jgi:hypothetical protein